MIVVNRKEVFRYLGYAGMTPDENIQRQIDHAIDDLNHCTPKYIARKYECKVHEEAVEFAGITVRSRDLIKNLQGCTQVICMATTLGLYPDRLIERANITDVGYGLILQASACAMIESYTDSVNEVLRTREMNQGLFLRPRFSCGYGDFALSHQKDFIRILELPKTLGVTLTDSLLMIPRKSVTAVIGLSKQSASLNDPCGSCNQDACLYRKETQ